MSRSRSPNRRTVRLMVPLVTTLLVLGMAACKSSPPPTPPADMARFEAAGPIQPTVDRAALVAAQGNLGPYQVRSGDVLQFEMAVVMRALSTDQSSVQASHVTRVDHEGKITLPTVGQFEVAGKTLGEIESLAANAYHPRFTVNRPSIVATVREYQTVKVSVVGAVKQPGIHALPGDEQSLVGALMRAGGVTAEGAGGIRIHSAASPDAQPVVLPVHGMNIPFVDVALRGGETIEVIRLDPKTFTIVGLVNRGGTYPYPPGASYTLFEAIGFGGGMDIVSQPGVVQVYRQDANGEIIAATFDLDEGWEKHAGVRIKPGDIVAVVDTPSTQLRRFVTDLLRGGAVIFGTIQALNQN